MLYKSSHTLRFRLKRGLAVALLIALVPAESLLAATASELFDDGNRLFRDDLYWAALLRYREASDAGMDTPLLNYNTGVAHYRARQHARARTALEKSAGYAPLRPISHYNLGLNAYSMGNTEQALDWFRKARDQQQRRDISRLARRAIRELQGEIDAARTVTVVAAREEERELTELDVRIRVGAGMDSNVFRSPSDPYVDLSVVGQPLITPVVSSGFYVPVSVSAKYQVNSLENEGFFGVYRMGGRFYQDKNLTNGNEYLQEIGFGSEYRKKNEEDDRETRIFSAFKIAQHHESYYDPDNGVERDIGGVSIADRLSYLRYGPEFWMRKRIGAITLGARAKGQLWNYDEVDVVPEYDHEYWNVGVTVQYRFTSTSLLRVGAEYYTRRFGDRPAFERDGTQPLGNPTIRYDYIEYTLEARQRITNGLWFSVGYTQTEREDKYLDYNTYMRDGYNAAFHLQLGERFDLEASGTYNIYDNEGAFAFNEPLAGRKILETTIGRVIATWKMTRSLDLIAEYSLREVASNDSRIQYDRNQIMIAVRWAP
ncbi:MAG: hypothetical protein HOI35_07330 [Woeseia sp.]|nr:hypothetical protein [Woeseia sp.]MBT6209815.1 hypothetical protein [Woeseia sp.]